MPSAEPQHFQLFSPGHLAGLAAIVLCTAVLVGSCRITRFRAARIGVSQAFGLIVAANELVWIISQARAHGFSFQFSLPLHLCDLSIIASVLALLTRRQFLYEFAYFFGFGGATQALLTPELQGGFPDYACVKFFFSHGSILASVVFLTLVFGMRPFPRSIPRMVVTGTLYMLIVGLLDWILGANYGYLCSVPTNPSLLDHLGPWPWYLCSLWTLGFLLILLLYLPFAIVDRLHASKIAQPR